MQTQQTLQAPDFLIACQDPMRRAAARVLRSPDLVEDAVQTAISLLWRKHAAQDPEPHVANRFATLAALQILRAQARREHHEALACASVEHSTELGPAEAAAQSEQTAALRRAIAALPSRMREPFERFVLGGHGYGCIAAELGIPLGTVRSRISRARELLRQSLKSEQPTDSRRNSGTAPGRAA